jgi:hypothetical protein
VFKTKKSRELCELRKSKPKLFWNHFKSKLEKCSNYVNPEEFREYFSSFEILLAIKDLKRNKAPCPADNLLNGFFIETSDILIGHITDCFTTIFNSGHFPKVWSYGYIVPI